MVKITQQKGRLIVILLGIFGICAVIMGSFMIAFFEQIIGYFLKKELTLKPGNEFFETIWKELPILVNQKIYIFNITNPDDFTNGKKPILQEVGPYVFQGRWKKKGIHTNDDDGTISYEDYKDYQFVPELSSADYDEQIYTLNAPLLAVINYVEEFTPLLFKSFVVDVMNGIFESYNETLLVHKTVRQIIYEGYYVPMVSDIVKVVEPFVTLPLKLINDTFGILHEKKHIGDGFFTIKSGVNGLEDYATIEKWNNKTKVNWWDGDKCNRITGTDGVQFAPGVQKQKSLTVFNPHLCRSVPLTYEKDITVHGIKTYRFIMPVSSFQSGDVNPENKCYCSGRDCPSGVIPLTKCKQGAPFALSLPHFFGEPSLKEALTGIRPSGEKQIKTYFDIEPRTGFVLNAAFRVQINGLTKKLPDYKPLKHVSDSIIPVLLLNEEAAVDVYLASYFKTRVETPIIVFRVICIASISIGAFWTVSAFVFFYCIQAKVKPDTLKHSVVLKTLNSVYTSVALWPPEEETKDGHEGEKTHL